MLAHTNNQLYCTHKKAIPVIIVYGSTRERMLEITAMLDNESYLIISLTPEDDFLYMVQNLSPLLVIIGGRCSPCNRFLIRRHASDKNKELLLSEPGIEYLNEPAEIARDVLQKLQPASKKLMTLQTVEYS